MLRAKKTTKVLWLTGLLCLLATAGCQAPIREKTPAEQKTDLISEFEQFNSAGDYNGAQKVLFRLEALPKGKETAAFGQALLAVNRGLYEAHNVFITLSLATQVQFSPSSGDTGLTQIIHTFARDFLRALVAVEESIGDVLQAYPDGKIVVNDFRVMFGSLQLFSICGEIDRTDLDFMKGTVHMVNTLLNLLLAQEFGISLVDTLGLVKWFDGRPECDPSIIADKRCLLRFVAHLLNDWPTFLTLDSESGVEFMKHAGDNYHDIAVSLLDLATYGSQESDPQDNDIIVVRYLPKTDIDEAKYSITVQNIYPLVVFKFSAEAILNDLFLISPESEPVTFSTTISGKFTEILARGVQHLEGKLPYMDLQDIIAPVADTVVRVLLESDVIDIGTLPGLDNVPVDAVDSLGLNLSDLVVLSIKEIVPKGAAALDERRFFYEPVDFRTFFPPSDYLLPGEDEPILAWELECGFDRTVFGLCSNPLFPPLDQPHFSGSSYSMEADGLAETSPYLSLVDPTLGGTLFLDYTKAVGYRREHVLPGVATGLVPATNMAFNYFLHRIFEYVLKAVNSIRGDDQ